MQGHPSVIEALNVNLRAEIAAIIQYSIAAELCDNWGCIRLSKYLEDSAREEMRHMRDLVERIIFLQGTPNVESLETLPVGASVVEIIQNVWNAEQDAIRTYNESIATCLEMQDEGSAELFRSNLKDEEEHINWAEAQLTLIQQAGLANYIAQLMEED